LLDGIVDPLDAALKSSDEAAVLLVRTEKTAASWWHGSGRRARIDGMGQYGMRPPVRELPGRARAASRIWQLSSLREGNR